MKKRWKLMACLGLILIVVIGMAVYSRKQSIKSLSDEFDWTKCDRLKVSVYVSDVGVQETIIEKEHKAFAELMDLFTEKEFQKSLRNGLLDKSQRSTGKNDSRWWIDFVYDEPVETPDGSTHVGELLEFSNFCGSMTISLRYKEEEYFVTTDDQEKWLEEITQILEGINEG